MKIASSLAMTTVLIAQGHYGWRQHKKRLSLRGGTTRQSSLFPLRRRLATTKWSFHQPLNREPLNLEPRLLHFHDILMTKK